jgi:hypothetical protein
MVGWRDKSAMSSSSAFRDGRSSRTTTAAFFRGPSRRSWSPSIPMIFQPRCRKIAGSLLCRGDRKNFSWIGLPRRLRMHGPYTPIFSSRLCLRSTVGLANGNVRPPDRFTGLHEATLQPEPKTERLYLLTANTKVEVEFSEQFVECETKHATP